MDTAALETWQNDTAAVIGIARYDDGGKRSVDRVFPGQTIVVTDAERRRNQSTVVRNEDDVFSNGTLRLIDSDAPDAAALKENPSAMSDVELDKLLNAAIKTFEKRVSEIGSPVLAERLYARAQASGAPQARLNIARDKLRELSGNPMKGDNLAEGLEDASGEPG